MPYDIAKGFKTKPQTKEGKRIADVAKSVDEIHGMKPKNHGSGSPGMVQYGADTSNVKKKKQENMD